MTVDHQRARDLEKARRDRERALANPPDLAAVEQMARSLTEDQWPVAHMLDELADWIADVTA